MAVGTNQGFAGNAEPFQVHLVTDAVARTGEPDAVLLSHGTDKPVVVGVFKAGLQGVVVDVSDAALGFDPRHAHRFKFQIGHGAGGVLSEGLVDLDTDFLSLNHFAVHQMGAEDFFCNCHTHK